LLLLSAELAIIGFLLQNVHTQTTLKYHGLKALYLISIGNVLLSILLGVIYKKCDRAYERNNMHTHMYTTFGTQSVEVFGQTMKLDSKSAEKQKTLQKLPRYLKVLRILLGAMETTLALAALFGTIFVFVFVLNI
jgi:hypothetical protein